MKSSQLSHAIFFITTIMLLTIFGILLFLLPQHAYSENENRYLTTMVRPSLTAFFDTSMQENLTNGANDQFIGRDLWMKFASNLQHTIGFQDIGDVYLGKEGYYFERILDSQISEKRYHNNLQSIEQFSSIYDTQTVFFPVPSKGTILKEYLPKNAVLYHADHLYEQAKNFLKKPQFIDLRQTLVEESKKSQLYFLTDHHWTMDAAYLAYVSWCDMHNRKSLPLTQFSPECVSSAFYGTLYSKAPLFCIQPDTLILPTKLPNAKISIDSNITDSIYDFGKLETKDKYGVYFGGNFGRIDIRRTELLKNKGTQKLLIFKDSFANSMVPFLMENYNEIIMIDLRYYNQPVSALMQEIQPDETMVLYELSNFAQDMNFFKILK